MRINLWWIGRGPADGKAIEHAKSHLAATFQMEVRVGQLAGRPADVLDARRGQCSSSRLLAWLDGKAPPGDDRVLGVTDEDLFIPVLTFVFGEAQLGGRAAVVSTARLVPGAGVPDGALLAGRLAKECAHELGHTFGLLHCDSAGCVMTRAVSIVGVDGKGGSFCRDCRSRLDDFLVGR